MRDILSLSWPAVWLPAALTALVIRADAKLIGPYWAFTEIIPGLEGVDTDLWYDRPALGFAIIRRYSYVGVAAAAVNIFVSPWGIAEAALTGAAIAVLLMWPLFFHGLPYGVLRRDWQLIPLYTGVVVSFVSAAVVGRLAWGYVDAQAGGEPLRWLRDHAIEGGFWSAMMVVGTAFFRGSLLSLRRNVRRRHEDNGA